MEIEEANEWIENNFFGDLTEEEMIENLKAMISRIYKSSDEKYNKLQKGFSSGKKRHEAVLIHLEECSDMTTKQALKIKSFDSEGIFKTNEQGFITEFPQFGKFGADKEIELFSKEVKN